jgi:tetratricopeptide (TPR) repeat protein
MTTPSDGKPNAAATLRRIRASLPDVLAARQLRAAERLIQEAEELDDDSRDLRELRAAILLDLQRPNEALDELNRAIELGGRTAHRLRLLASGYRELGDPERAVEAARNAAALSHGDPASQVLLSELELAAGNPPKAREAAEAAIRGAPQDGRGIAAIAAVEGAEGKHEEQIAHLSQAIAINPGNPRFETALGQALLDSGRRSEAVKHWVSVLARYPTYRPAAKALVDSVGKRLRSRRAAIVFAVAAAVYGLDVTLALSYGTKWDDAILAALRASVIAFVLAVVVSRVIDRWRWPPGFGLMLARAFRLVDEDDPKPAVRERVSRIALILMSIVLLLVAIGRIGTYEEVAAIVFIIVFGPAITLVVAQPRLVRRQLRNLARLKTVPFDPVICHCAGRTVVSGRHAIDYRARHLQPSGFDLIEGVEVLRCPVSKRSWLFFPERVGHENEVPILMRLSMDPVADPDLKAPGYL